MGCVLDLLARWCLFHEERPRPLVPQLRIRAVVFVQAILLIGLGAFRDGGINSDPWRAGPGLFLFALALQFAIWDRLHIRRNWGTPMSQKDEPEL
jgi:hypothetical protein